MNINDWESFKKTVRPIKKSNKIKLKTSKSKINSSDQLTKNQYNFEKEIDDLEIQVSESWGNLEKNTLKKILKGKIKIMSQLDLHGQNIKDSKKLVLEFINKNHLLNKRLLLLITGKGARLPVEEGWKGIGKLKTSIPNWLRSKSLNDKILWFDHAPPEKGGDGAYLIYLKKITE